MMEHSHDLPQMVAHPFGSVSDPQYACGYLKKKLRFYLFLERGKGREKESERNINVWLSLACPLLGTWPTTQACALTGNLTSNPLVHRPVVNPLSHTSQGIMTVLNGINSYTFICDIFLRFFFSYIGSALKARAILVTMYNWYII